MSVKGVTGSLSGGTLDILTYDDDRLGRLDSYQRIETFGGGRISIGHRSGGKTMILCYNLCLSPFKWEDICSIASLKGLRKRLEEEDPKEPFMTGTCNVEDENPEAETYLAPAASRIYLRSISCDFSGTAYSESILTDVKAYLTNVNAEYPILGGDDSRPERIINAGMLNMEDVKAFRHPDMIYREIAEKLGKTCISTDICFLCYPNTSDADISGSPYTRLVIEGRIDSHTYYWPVSINRHKSSDSGQEGISRNCSYIYDISIRRKGVTDPDTPIDPTTTEIRMTIKPWNEKENCNISF